MEKNRHIILIVSGIETRDVDQRTAQAIPKILSVERGLPIIEEGHRLPVIRSDLNVLVLGRERRLA